MKINKTIKGLCTPSYAYLFISLFTLIVLGLQNVGNSQQYCIGGYNCQVQNTGFIFVMKIIYIIFWVWLLDILCKNGYTSISWFLFLLPYSIMILGIAFIISPKPALGLY